jgi:hypothetical protein
MTLREPTRVIVVAGLLGLLGSIVMACDAFGPSADPSAPQAGDPLPPPPGPGSQPSCKPCDPALLCFDCGGGCSCMEAPIEQRPWVVPLSARGEDGWRSSKPLLCASLQEVTDHAVWADRHGVFAAISGTSNGVFADLPDDDAGVVEENRIPGQPGLRTRVFHNQGSGWSLRADLNGAIEAGLTAVSASKLILYGNPRQLGNACALGILSGNMLACEPVATVLHAHMVDEARAFALTETNRVLEHDGNAWSSPATAVPGARSIWADDDELIVVGSGGQVHRMSGDAWVTEQTGTPDLLTAVWGRNGDDLWVGDHEGRVFHFDGTSWRQIAQLGGVTCTRRNPIQRIAGAVAGSHVWIHTATQLARWDGSKLESFGNWTCVPLGAGESIDTLRVEDLSVVAEDDVFIAFSDGSGASQCGGSYAVHFDGSEFHRF